MTTFNLAVLTLDGVNALVSAGIERLLPDTTVRARHNKTLRQSRQSLDLARKQERARRQVVDRLVKRAERRTLRAALRDTSSMAVSWLPVAGTIAGSAAYVADMRDACDWLDDIAELNAAFEAAPAASEGAHLAGACHFWRRVPDADDVQQADANVEWAAP